MRVETARARQLRLADTGLLVSVLVLLAGFAAWQDWGGVRAALMGAFGLGGA